MRIGRRHNTDRPAAAARRGRHEPHAHRPRKPTPAAAGRGRNSMPRHLITNEKSVGRHPPDQPTRPAINQRHTHRGRAADNATPMAWAGPPTAAPPDQGAPTNTSIDQAIMLDNDGVIVGGRPDMGMIAMGAAGRRGAAGGPELPDRKTT